MADRKKKKPASLGCLFWIAFILLVIVLFFFNKKNIAGVLEKTGAADLFAKPKTTTEKTAADTEPLPIVPQIQPSGDPAVTAAPVQGDGSVEPAKTKTAVPATTKAPVKVPAATPETPAPSTTSVKPASNAPAPAAVKPVPVRKATLFFVTIDADGRVLRKEVVREIPQTDSPLSETLLTLFKGTNGAESGKGFRSLIPQGTRLLSATVKDGVATLNLSEEFQFNQYGIEGYLGQLSQIVFTATAFSTVKSVQFLIDGQRREYLGAEGVWIGTPLSRDKF